MTGGPFRGVIRFVTPIPDEAVPTHMAKLALAAGSAASFTLVAGLVGRALEAARGHLDLQAALIYQTIVLCILLPLVLVSRTVWGRRRPEAIVFFVGVESIFDVAMLGYLHGGENLWLPYAAAVPLGLAALVPGRPSTAFALGVLAAIVSVAVGRFSLGLPVDELEALGSMCVTYGLLAAVGVQLQRRFWRDMELTQARARLIAADRLAYMGRMSASLAHELKTPIAATMNHLSGLLTLAKEMNESVGHPDVGDDDRREIIAEILESIAHATESAKRTARTIQSMRESSALRAPTSKSHFTIGSRIDLLRMVFKERQRLCSFSIEIEGPEVELHGDPAQLDQVLTNLIRNAFDAMSASGRGQRVIAKAEKRSGGVLLAIEDEGPGVAEDLRERIFEESFTTKSAEDGLGIGLWLCRNIVVSTFGGSLTLAPTKSAKGGGARFECWLPDIAPEAPPLIRDLAGRPDEAACDA